MIGKAENDRVVKLEEKVGVFACGEEIVDLACLMEELGKRGVGTLLLEGGATLNWGMLEKGLVDEVKVAISPRIVGGKDALSLVEGAGFEKIREGIALKLLKHRTVGSDLILEYEVTR